MIQQGGHSKNQEQYLGTKLDNYHFDSCVPVHVKRLSPKFYISQCYYLLPDDIHDGSSLAKKRLEYSDNTGCNSFG